MRAASTRLSPAQQEFMNVVDGKFTIHHRREKDGSVMPYLTETKTVEVLVRLGLLKWVHAGKDGYTYNGVVRASGAKT